MNTYDISETQKTATWVKSSLGILFNCSNCKHTEDAGYPARSFRLGNFCPNCGFKMTNSQFVRIEYDYD